MLSIFKKLIPLFLFTLLWSGNLLGAAPVVVGGYIFPPFVEQTNEGEISGITIDLIEALNQIQDEYDFQFFFTSSRRRYKDFQKGSYDMLFFESIHWGWQSQKVESSRVFLTGEEVFIALKNNAKDQRYFDSLKNKSMVGMLGYHYAFAQFNAEPSFLAENYNMHLTNDFDTNIRLVLKGRRDIAIVTKSYLDNYLRVHNSDKSKLLISDRIDQEYQHAILLRKNSILDVLQMNMLLDKLEQTGQLKTILDKYAITYQQTKPAN